MQRWLKIIGLVYLITYLLVLLLWISGSPNGCSPGEEIEEGCKIVFPATYTFLAFINIPIAFVASVIGIAVIGLFKQRSK